MELRLCWSYELQRLRGPDSFDSTLSLYRCIEICDNRKDIRLVRYNNVYDGERFVTWSGICDMRVPKTEQDQHKAARGSASIFISPTGELQITPPVSEPQMQREPDRAKIFRWCKASGAEAPTLQDLSHDGAWNLGSNRLVSGGSSIRQNKSRLSKATHSSQTQQATKGSRASQPTPPVHVPAFQGGVTS